LERAKDDKADAPTTSRLERMMKENGDDYEPEMPEVVAEYILGYMTELGLTMTSGGYPAPLTHVEIDAWQDLVGIELRPWETRFIRRLSSEYIAEELRARKLDRPEPSAQHGSVDDGKPDLRAVAVGLQRALKAMVGQ
jgi:hypothetical protein